MARVLVVDDDPLTLELLTDTIRRLGHHATQAHSGQRALKWLADDDFDLVIADIFMPNGTGLELLITMHTKRIEVPFACVSGGDGNLFKPYAATMTSLGAVAVLQKPVDPDQVGALLASIAA
jgi:DNA-binding NtrC family response regulator